MNFRFALRFPHRKHFVGLRLGPHFLTITKKCTGEDGDIAKIVKIAMQKIALHFLYYLHY